MAFNVHEVFALTETALASQDGLMDQTFVSSENFVPGIGLVALITLVDLLLRKLALLGSFMSITDVPSNALSPSVGLSTKHIHDNL